MPLADKFCDFVDIERHFGNKDDVSAARNAAVSSDPTRIASHDFNDDDAVVRFRGGMYAIDRAGSYVDRSIKTKCKVCTGEVVVDSFGNADDFRAPLRQFLRD